MSERCWPKQSLDELALFGGPPAFSETLHVGRPRVLDRARLVERLDGILERRWLSNDGVLVRELERRVAEHAAVAACVAVCNGTAALELIARALGLRGEVIVPSFTFVATAHAFEWLGLTPVFCDIDPTTHTIDPRLVERLITPRTSAIVGVHLWGRPCDVEALAEIGHRRRLRLVFDAAHAFGCTHHGRPIGGFGDAEAFSFHATKLVTCGEGGAIVTDDPELANRLRLMRNFGFAHLDTVISSGTNAKMSELAAALGLTSLEAFEATVATNRERYEAYRRGLAGIDGLTLLTFDEDECNNYQYVVAELDEGASIERDLLVEALHAERVRARRYFWPGCHAVAPYAGQTPGVNEELTATAAVARRVVVLPTGDSLSPADVTTVCELLAFVLDHGAEIGARHAAGAAPHTTSR